MTRDPRSIPAGVYAWHRDGEHAEVAVNHLGQVWRRIALPSGGHWHYEVRAERAVKRAMRLMDGEEVR